MKKTTTAIGALFIFATGAVAGRYVHAPTRLTVPEYLKNVACEEHIDTEDHGKKHWQISNGKWSSTDLVMLVGNGSCAEFERLFPDRPEAVPQIFKLRL